jgi:hypothetical protein
VARAAGCSDSLHGREYVARCGRRSMAHVDCC